MLPSPTIERPALTDDAIVWMESVGTDAEDPAELWWAPLSADGTAGEPTHVRSLAPSSSLRPLHAHGDWAMVADGEALVLVHLPTGEEHRHLVGSGGLVEPRLLTETYVYFAYGGFRGDLRRIDRTAL